MKKIKIDVYDSRKAKIIFKFKKAFFTRLKRKKNVTFKFIHIQIILIFCLSFLYFLIFKKGNNTLSSLRVALCTMGKKDNLYIREYIKHYRKLGVDKIFIYDDNDPKTEKFSDIVNNILERKYVKVYDNIQSYIHKQGEAFTNCYNLNKNDYDWFIMVDTDEYLIIVNVTLKNYLSKNIFDKCDFIKINWVIATDNELLHYENKSLFERFKGPYQKSIYIKSIIRGKIENLTYWVHSPKISPIRNVTCNNEGKQIYYQNMNFESIANININKAYIIHFKFKSTEEFINKMKRGYGKWFGKRITGVINTKIAEYFITNKITREKVEYIERELNISLQRYKSYKLI